MLNKIIDKIEEKFEEAKRDFEADTEFVTKEELGAYLDGLEMAITLIEEFKNEPVAIHCFGQQNIMNRQKAINRFSNRFYTAEGESKISYGNILADLIQGANDVYDE